MRGGKLTSGCHISKSCCQTSLSAQKMESVIKSKEGFNPDRRNRRPYQMPTDSAENNRFVISSPLFMRQNVFNNSKPIKTDYVPHAWLNKAISEQPGWMVNPNRPRLLAYSGKKLTELNDAGSRSSSNFTPGDVVWKSFTLSYVIGPTFWAPEYRPLELICVGHLSNPEGRRDGDVMTDIGRKPLTAGTSLSLPNCE